MIYSAKFIFIRTKYIKLRSILPPTHSNFVPYHGTTLPSYVKNLPLSPSPNPCKVLNIPPTLTSASNTAPSPPILVFTHPGSIQTTTTPLNLSLKSPL